MANYNTVFKFDANVRGFDRGVGSINKQLSSLGTHAARAAGTVKSAGAGIGGSLGKFAKYALSVAVLSKAFNVLGRSISSAMGYIETINLFNATMGESAVVAQDFMEAMSSALGLDPVELMKTQGTMNVLATSIGNTAEAANIMSQGLTQLAVDWASLRDMPVADVVTKLESGIVGITRSVRMLGLDISAAGLQNEAMLLGLDINVNSLDQASKMQLRYSAMLRQSQVAMGDFARTAEQPANQMRILKEQIGITSRNIGAIFIPAVSAAFPYVIAIAKFIGQIARTLAELAGFEAFEKQAAENAQAAAGGIKILGDDVDDLTESVKGAKRALKDIQGFDELNRLTSGTGVGDPGGINDVLRSIQIELPEYDMGFTNFKLKADEVLDKIWELWDAFKLTPLGVAWNSFVDSLKPLTKTIGEGIVWVWENGLEPMGKWAKEDYLPTLLDTLTEAFKALDTVFGFLGPALKFAWEFGLKPLLKAFGIGNTKSIEVMGDALGAFNRLVEGIDSTIHLDIDFSLSNIIDTLNSLLRKFSDTIYNATKLRIIFPTIPGGTGGRPNPLIALYTAPAVSTKPVGGLTPAQQEANKRGASTPLRALTPSIGTTEMGYDDWGMPLYARGAVADKATLGIFGEDGTEALVPLEKNLGWLDVVAGELFDRMQPKIPTASLSRSKNSYPGSSSLSSSSGATSSASEDLMYRAFGRALREMPESVIIMDRETVGRSMKSYANDTQRRYNKA